MVEANSNVVEDASTLVSVGRQLHLVCRLDSSASLHDNNIPPEEFEYSWTHNGCVCVLCVYVTHFHNCHFSRSSQLSRQVEVKEGGAELVITAGLSDSGSYLCEVNSPPNIMTPISAHINIKVEGDQ